MTQYAGGTRHGITALIVVGVLAVVGLVSLVAAPEGLPSAKDADSLSDCPSLGRVIESRQDWRRFEPTQVNESARYLSRDPSIKSAGVLWNARALIAQSSLAAVGKARSAGALRFNTKAGDAPTGNGEASDPMAFRRYVPVLFEPTEVIYSRQDDVACGYITFLWVPAGPADDVAGKHLTIRDLTSDSTSGLAFLSIPDEASIGASGLPVLLYASAMARSLTRDQSSSVLPALIKYFYHRDGASGYVNRETGEFVTVNEVRAMAADFATKHK